MLEMPLKFSWFINFDALASSSGIGKCDIMNKMCMPAFPLSGGLPKASNPHPWIHRGFVSSLWGSHHFPL